MEPHVGCCLEMFCVCQDWALKFGDGGNWGSKHFPWSSRLISCLKGSAPFQMSKGAPKSPHFDAFETQYSRWNGKSKKPKPSSMLREKLQQYYQHQPNRPHLFFPSKRMLNFGIHLSYSIYNNSHPGKKETKWISNCPSLLTFTSSYGGEGSHVSAGLLYWSELPSPAAVCPAQHTCLSFPMGNIAVWGSNIDQIIAWGKGFTSLP